MKLKGVFTKFSRSGRHTTNCHCVRLRFEDGGQPRDFFVNFPEHCTPELAIERLRGLVSRIEADECDNTSPSN